MNAIFNELVLLFSFVFKMYAPSLFLDANGAHHGHDKIVICQSEQIGKIFEHATIIS